MKGSEAQSADGEAVSFHPVGRLCRVLTAMRLWLMAFSVFHPTGRIRETNLLENEGGKGDVALTSPNLHARAKGTG